MRRIWTSLIFALSGISTHAHAGWSSGGGALVKDSMNPWWIQNTTTVSYCIKLDRRHFSLAEPQVHAEVNSAINYWKQQFQNAYTVIGGLQILVGTQTFVKSECNGDTDLVFQFGVMTQEQLDKIDAKEYVSLAVRTEYDRQNLKGKGFIYVAPDLGGPLSPNFVHFNHGVWNQRTGSTLKWVLAHELGHVFGIPHSSDGWANSRSGKGLMSAAMPQSVVTRGYETITNDSLPDYFKASRPLSDKFCSPTPVNESKRKFYGLPENIYCIKYDWNPSARSVDIHYAYDHRTPSFIKAGSITFSTSNRTFQSGIYFWLSAGQRVVRINGQFAESAFAPGSQLMVYEKMKGSYSSTDGSLLRDVYVDLPLNDNYFLSIEGILDGEIAHNL